MITLTVATVAIILVFLSIWFLKKATPDYPKKTNYTVAIAGDVNGQGTVCSPCILNSIDYFKYRIGDEYINVNDYSPFVVDGDSMSKEGINSGDIVLVKELEKGDLNISKDKVILLSIDPRNKNGDAEYKLRHFLGYVSRKEGALKDILEDIARETVGDIAEDEIREKYGKAKEDYPEDDQFIYSSTFKVTERRLSCSFHSLNSLVGQVEYSFPQGLLN